MRKHALPVALTVILMLTGLSACTIGDTGMNNPQTTSTTKQTSQQSLTNQKQAAEIFVKYQPMGLTQIKFTGPGGVNPLVGIWNFTVEIIIDGKTYNMYLSSDGTVGKLTLPSGRPVTPAPVKVIFSDGSTEVLQ